MNSLNKLYQNVIDEKTENIYNTNIQDIFNLKDYGQYSENIGGTKINIGWWKYQINTNEIHLVFKTSRRAFLFLHKVCLNGVKIKENKIEYLTKEEIGNYD